MGVQQLINRCIVKKINTWPGTCHNRAWLPQDAMYMVSLMFILDVFWNRGKRTYSHCKIGGHNPSRSMHAHILLQNKWCKSLCRLKIYCFYEGLHRPRKKTYPALFGRGVQISAPHPTYSASEVFSHGAHLPLAHPSPFSNPLSK